MHTVLQHGAKMLVLGHAAASFPFARLSMYDSGGHWQITRCLEEWAKREGLDRAPTRRCIRDEVDMTSAPASTTRPGTPRLQWPGHPKWCRAMLELFEGHPEYPTTEKLRI